jgi:hypothetical protein
VARVDAALATPPAATLEAGPLPQAPTLRALLHPTYEPGDGSADGAQLVDEQWWHPVMGCDSLQEVADNARDVITRKAGSLPPRPPMTHSVDRFDLVRYGVTWEGSKDKPLLTPRPDGYWTPWHIAAQLPQVGAEISDEELAEVASAAGLAWETWEDELFAFARAVLARWGGAAVQTQPVSERLPGAEDLDAANRCWWFAESHEGRDTAPTWAYTWHGDDDTHWLPHWALQVPAAGKGEVQP